MDQQAGLHLFGRQKRQFHMRVVHGIPSLEGDNTAPTEAGEFGT